MRFGFILFLLRASITSYRAHFLHISSITGPLPLETPVNFLPSSDDNGCRGVRGALYRHANTNHQHPAARIEKKKPCFKKSNSKQSPRPKTKNTQALEKNTAKIIQVTRRLLPLTSTRLLPCPPLPSPLHLIGQAVEQEQRHQQEVVATHERENPRRLQLFIRGPCVCGSVRSMKAQPPAGHTARRGLVRKHPTALVGRWRQVVVAFIVSSPMLYCCCGSCCCLMITYDHRQFLAPSSQASRKKKKKKCSQRKMRGRYHSRCASFRKLEAASRHTSPGVGKARQARGMGGGGVEGNTRDRKSRVGGWVGGVRRGAGGVSLERKNCVHVRTTSRERAYGSREPSREVRSTGAEKRHRVMTFPSGVFLAIVHGGCHIHEPLASCPRLVQRLRAGFG